MTSLYETASCQETKGVNTVKPNSQAWVEKQKKLDAECDDIIAHPENYEHYTSFKDLYAAILRDPEYQKGVVSRVLDH